MAWRADLSDVPAGRQDLPRVLSCFKDVLLHLTCLSWVTFFDRKRQHAVLGIEKRWHTDPITVTKHVTAALT